MNQFLQKISAVWILRISLGAMYLYSSIDIFRHTTGWYWAIPKNAFMQQIVTAGGGADIFLKGNASLEFFFAIVFLLPFAPRVLVLVAALFNALEMAAILMLTGTDAITFRDIGLIGNGLALYLLLIQKKT